MCIVTAIKGVAHRLLSSLGMLPLGNHQGGEGVRRSWTRRRGRCRVGGRSRLRRSLASSGQFSNQRFVLSGLPAHGVPPRSFLGGCVGLDSVGCPLGDAKCKTSRSPNFGAHLDRGCPVWRKAAPQGGNIYADST